MNLQTIANCKLKVTISPISAELMSIQDNADTEYLWQGDPTYWSRRAFNIFPYIARLTEGSYYYEGKRYNMDIHGFLPKTEMAVESATEDSVTFFMRDSESTLKSYPFPFELRIGYTLIDNRINVSYDVLNTGKKRMFFGIGGHPGFNVPLDPELEFTDYYLEFAEKHKPLRIGFSDDCFVNGIDKKFTLEEDYRLPLRHGLFDDDAIILQDASHTVTLKSDKDSKAITVSYPDMPFIGFWHRPQTDAPYVCIEPWSSLPSRDSIVEDITEQPNLIGLDPGKRYSNVWSIEIHA